MIGVFERGAEAALKGVAEVGGVLAPERLIESVVRLEVAQNLGWNGLFRRERSAGRKAQHEEGRRDNDEQDRDGLEQAAGDEAEHFGGQGTEDGEQWPDGNPEANS